MAKESINLKEAIQIAKIIMVVSEERMPIIREVFEMAGVDIESLGEMEEFKALTEQETFESLEELLSCVTQSRKVKNGEYRISPQEFKSLCEERGLNAHRVRGQLAGLGAIRQSAWAGGHAVVGGGQFYGTSDGKSLNKILHSIVLGSWQQWMRDPYTLSVNGKVKVSKNYTYDLTGASYEDTGISYPETVSGAYPHEYRTVPGFGALPTFPYKGSSITGGCDGFWVNVGITAVALRFGGCDNGSLCGSRALLLHNTAASAYWDIGCAILLLPPVGVAA